MDRTKVAAAALIAVGVGFIVGFAWGQGTREATPGSTDVAVDGSVVTVRLRLGDALRQGLDNLLR